MPGGVCEFAVFPSFLCLGFHSFLFYFGSFVTSSYLFGPVKWCVLYDLAVCCGVLITMYGASKPTCEKCSALAMSPSLDDSSHSLSREYEGDVCVGLCVCACVFVSE